MSPKPTPRETLTPKEVAVIFGVHVLTVRRWIKRGILPAFRFGATLRIHRSDIARMRANPPDRLRADVCNR